MNSTFYSNNAYFDSFTFTTTLNSFAGSIIKNNALQTVRWVLNNEKAQAADHPYYTMTGSSPYTVEIQSDKLEEISTINFTNQQLTNSLDLHKLSGLTYFYIPNNLNLTAITLPNSSAIYTTFMTRACDLRNLDCSKLSGLGGNFNVGLNYNLTALTLPNSSQIFSAFDAHVCGFKNLNCSGLSGLGGYFSISDCTTFTALTLPNSSQIFLRFYAYVNFLF